MFSEPCWKTLRVPPPNVLSFLDIQETIFPNTLAIRWSLVVILAN